LLAVVILLLRRPPVLLLLRPLLPSVRGPAEALYLGWFGPIAVAAIYYAAMMEHRLGEPRVWYVVSLIICASAVAHGVTAAPLTRALGRTARNMGSDGGRTTR
jgi:sodium/hydrogen antiporter